MRRIQRVATTVTVASVLLAGLALPVAADDEVVTVTNGAAGGTKLTATAGYFGGSSKGGRTCPWHKVWPSNAGSVLGVPITGFLPSLSFVPFAGPVFASIFGSDDPADAIRSMTPEDAQTRSEEAAALGEEAPEIMPDLPAVFGEEEFTQIEVIEGYEGLFGKIPLVLGGAPDLGVVISDTIDPIPPPPGPVVAGPGVAIPNTFPDEDEVREYYQNSYPLVQRGSKLKGGELWWDPFYMEPGADKAGCPDGVFYSPRENNADVLLPDVLATVTDNLPAVLPRIIPRDRYDGWAYVQVPTNFGVANASIQSTAAHAEAEYIDPDSPSSATDSVWAQVEAIATNLVFNPGDGSDPVTCDLRNMAYDPDVPGPCSYVYLDSSNVVPEKEFTATVTVIWQGLYTSSDNPGVPEIIEISPTTAAFKLQVAEARSSVADTR